MNHDVCFTAEDAEYVTSTWVMVRGRAVYARVYYVVAEVEPLDGGEAGRITCLPIQVVVNGESPVGCNSCDLGDHELQHHEDCPTRSVGLFHIRFVGEVTYAP